MVVLIKQNNLFTFCFSLALAQSAIKAKAAASQHAAAQLQETHATAQRICMSQVPVWQHGLCPYLCEISSQHCLNWYFYPFCTHLQSAIDAEAAASQHATAQLQEAHTTVAVLSERLGFVEAELSAVQQEVGMLKVLDVTQCSSKGRSNVRRREGKGSAERTLKNGGGCGCFGLCMPSMYMRVYIAYYIYSVYIYICTHTYVCAKRAPGHSGGCAVSSAAGSGDAAAISVAWAERSTAQQEVGMHLFLLL